MDEKDVKIQALESELGQQINEKLTLRQQVLMYQSLIEEAQKETEEDKGE